MRRCVFMASLQYSDTTNKSGLLQACERKVFASDYGRITGDTTLKEDFTVRLNDGQDWVTDIILKSDTRWQWDDTNHSDYPIFTETMVAGQTDYPLDVEHVKFLRVAIKDSDGDFRFLEPIDPRDVETPLDTYFDTDGLPKYYDKRANSIFIYPAPAADDVTLSEGLKIWTQRTADYFTTSDSSQVPGVPSLFHEAVADYASWSYAEDNTMSDKAERLARKLYGGGTIQGWADRIADYYSRRDVDDKPGLGVSNSRRLSKLR